MRKVRVLVPLLALGLVAAACGGGDDGDGDVPEGLSGEIVVSGSSTVQPISSLVAELFAESNPDVQISVDGPGTGDGFALFCEGQTDISDASRPIKEDEEAPICAENGVEYVELEVGIDGLTVMTNPANDAVTCLNYGDLYALLGPESDGFANWSDADALAAEVGGNGGFPDAPLDVTAPGEESGTYDSFIEIALGDIIEERGSEEALRPDYTSSGNDNVIIQGIEGSESSLGFVGFAYAQNAGEGVKEIEIDGGEGCVGPSEETISGGTYPIARSLYIYVNTNKLAESEALKAFVDLYLSDTGIKEAVSQAGYVTLPDERIQATRDAWAGATG
jgi:phosphate transport system substrate-binding protein